MGRQRRATKSSGGIRANIRRGKNAIRRPGKPAPGGKRRVCGGGEIRAGGARPEVRGEAKVYGGGEAAAVWKGPANKVVKNFPVKNPGTKQIAQYDPRTNKVSGLDTCFATDHNAFSDDGSLFFGQSTSTVGWFNVDVY